MSRGKYAQNLTLKLDTVRITGGQNNYSEELMGFCDIRVCFYLHIITDC